MLHWSLLSWPIYVCRSASGLNNRRCFEYLVQQLSQKNLNQPAPISLLVFDVDHFKQINDRYGHDVGDQVLQMIAQTTCNEMRRHDVLARYGGEEFIACLTETSLDDALKIAERLRHKIENIMVNLEHGHRLDFHRFN